MQRNSLALPPSFLFIKSIINDNAHNMVAAYDVIK